MGNNTGGTQRQTTVLFARQPIYDRNQALAGCELLFRSAIDDALSEPFNGDLATHQVMLSAFTETNIREVCENTPAFINFTANTLKADIPFAPDEMTIEILETVEADAEVIDSIRRCRSQGYRIALDDYCLPDIGHPLLPYVDIVKLDYPCYERDGLLRTVERLKSSYPQVTLLAEKIETQKDFQLCMKAGCDLFQGYFLARPVAIEGQRMPSDRLSLLQLLAKLNHIDTTNQELTELIQRDPFLSVRLMKMASSSYYSRTCDMASVEAAITLLGRRRIRSLASMLVLTRIDDKPHALQKLALTRGYLCDALAAGLPRDAAAGFTVGLFSSLDALFNRPLSSVLDDISLHERLRQAILEYKGPLGKILSTAIHLERGELDPIDWAGLAELGLTPEKLSQAQQRAIELANEQA